MLALLGLALLGAAVAFVCYKTLVAPRLSPLRHLPGPKPANPLMGNMKAIIDEPPCQPQLRWTKDYGPIVHYTGLLGSQRLLVTSPELVKRVLRTNASNYPKPKQIMQQLKDILGDGLVTSEGELHARHRKLLNPGFHFSNLQAMLPTFLAQSLKLADSWEEYATEGAAGKRELNVHESFTAFTLDVIGLSGFGYEFNAMSTDDNEVTKAVKTLLRPLSIWALIRSIVPWVKHIPIERHRMEVAARDTVRGTVRKLIRARLESAQKGGTATLGAAAGRAGGAAAAAGDTVQGRDTLLDILLEAAGYYSGANEGGAGGKKPEMSQEQVIDHAFTFLTAGHETTSNALSWTWYLLGQPENAAIQDRVRAEVRACLPDGDASKLTWDSLAQMKYLWAVCQESLRLFPPVPLTNRTCASDDTFEFEGRTITIPKGTTVFVSSLVMSRLPQYFGDDAEVFRPERWLRAPTTPAAAPSAAGSPFAHHDKVSTTPFTFLPFLAGDRICIGQQFAQKELLVCMAVLLSRFALTMAPGCKVVPKLTVTMRPTPELLMTVRKAT